MYDEIYKGYEEERERIYEKLKEVDILDPEYDKYFTRLKELHVLICEQRTVEREDKKVETEAFRLRDEELRKNKIHLDPNKLVEIGVFASIALLALVVEANGDILKFDTTKNILKMNRI